MLDILRDSPAGQLLYWITNGKIYSYPEDDPKFDIDHLLVPVADPEKLPPLDDSNNGKGSTKPDATATSRTLLITWYGDNDPENPHNWSSFKRSWVSGLLFAYTFSVYLGSCIYTSSEAGISEQYHTTGTVASLGLALYVVGYGVAPMVLTPLTEIPVIGRNPPYIITYFLFVMMVIPFPLVNNLGGILVVRFLQGFFGSPALATAGASYGDFWSPQSLPFVITLWSAGATLGPSLGPLVAGFAVQAKGWRWSGWELLWLSGPICILMFLALPESAADTILLRRAQRIRRSTGRRDVATKREVEHSTVPNFGQVAFNALIKPWEINAKDFALLFSTFYMALIYGIYYSFFESFPLVYMDMYGFNQGVLGLAFLSVLGGLVAGVIMIWVWFAVIAPKRMVKMMAGGKEVPPEFYLMPGLYSTFLVPIGLFIFAWTARPSIHWIVSLIGVGITMCGIFQLTQCILIYLPFTYPRYAGSLFAANGLARALLAAAAILFSGPMFDKLHVNAGVSLLAGCSAVCCLGIYYLYLQGGKLRVKSRFASS